MPLVAGKKRKAYAWRALFGLAMLAMLFVLVDPRAMLDALAHAHPGYFLAGYALCLVGLAARAWRWRLIMRHMGLHVPFGRVLEVYAISYWFNTFMPGSMGGDLYKIYDVAQASDKKIRPFVTVFAERVTGVLALLVVAVVAVVLFRDQVPVPPWVLALILKGGTLATVMLLLAVLRFDTCWAFTTRHLPVVRRLLSEERANSIGAVCEEMRSKRIIFIEAFGWGLGIQVLVLATFYVLALSITDRVPGVYFFTLFPLIEITSLAPITINGVGIKEGLILFSLKYADVGPAFALGMGILFRLVAVLLALQGGLLLLLRKPAGWKTRYRAP